MGALTTSIYHTQYTRGSLVRTPDRYLGRLWVRILSETRIFFVGAFHVFPMSCKLTNFHLSHITKNQQVPAVLLPQDLTSYYHCVFTDLCKPFPVYTSKVQRFFEKSMSKRTQHGCHHSKAQLPYSVPVPLFKWV